MAKRVSLIFWFITLAAVFIVCTNSITDADFWWHLKTGEYIWETKSIPKTDIFSHTASGREWTVHEWLSQVILYGAYKLAGFNGIVYFTALMAVATFGVIGLVLRAGQVPDLISQSVIFLGAVVGAPFFIPRPQLFYFFLWAVLILILALYERGKKEIIWLVPFLFLVWANFHASIHLLILLIGLYLLAKALPFFPGKTEGFLKKHRGLIMATIAGALLALINPNSFRIYTYIFKGIPFLKKSAFEITEWRSLLVDPTAWQAWFFIGFYLLVLLSFVIGFKKEGKKRMIERAVVVFPLIFLAFLVSKFLPLSLLVAVPFLGTNLRGIFSTPKVSTYSDPGSEQTYDPELSFIIGLGLALTFLGLAVGYHYLLGRPIQSAWHNFPYQATQFVLDEEIKGPMYNPYNWGGFLIWRFYPQYKVFIDGRYEMFEPDITDDFKKIQEGIEDWEQALAKHGVNFLILPPKDVHPQLAISSDWVMIYFDNLAVVFIKNIPQNKEIIDKLGYFHIRPFLPTVYVEKGKEPEAIVEYQRSLELNPDNFKAHYDLGVVYINLGKYVEAEHHFRKALEIFPDSTRSRYNLAHCLEKQGRMEEAEEEYLEYQFLMK